MIRAHTSRAEPTRDRLHISKEIKKTKYSPIQIVFRSVRRVSGSATCSSFTVVGYAAHSLRKISRGYCFDFVNYTSLRGSIYGIALLPARAAVIISGEIMGKKNIAALLNPCTLHSVVPRSSKVLAEKAGRNAKVSKFRQCVINVSLSF